MHVPEHCMTNTVLKSYRPSAPSRGSTWPLATVCLHTYCTGADPANSLLDSVPGKQPASFRLVSSCSIPKVCHHCLQAARDSHLFDWRPDSTLHDLNPCSQQQQDIQDMLLSTDGATSSAGKPSTCHAIDSTCRLELALLPASSS